MADQLNLAFHTNFPPEIWHNICSFLQQGDLFRLSRVNKRLASVYSLIEHLDASTLTQKEIREKVNGFKILASTIKKLKKLSSLHIPVLKWPYGGEEEPLASVLFQLSKLTYLRLECRPAPYLEGCLTKLKAVIDLNLDTLYMRKGEETEDLINSFSYVNILRFGEPLSTPPSSLTHLTNLQHLILSRELTSKECHVLRSFTQLTYLKFSTWCKVRDETLELFLPNLTNLIVLELQEKNISDVTLRNLTNHQKLEKLNFENNPRITNKGLSYISHLTKLKSINMKGMTGIDPIEGESIIRNWINLQTLILFPKVTNETCRVFTLLTKLENLSFSGEETITRQGVQYLTCLRRLTQLVGSGKLLESCRSVLTKMQPLNIVKSPSN